MYPPPPHTHTVSDEESTDPSSWIPLVPPPALRHSPRTPLEAELAALAQRLDIIAPEEIEVVRLLGSGSYGEVYLAKWNESDVAVKCLNARCVVCVKVGGMLGVGGTWVGGMFPSHLLLRCYHTYCYTHNCTHWWTPSCCTHYTPPPQPASYTSHSLVNGESGHMSRKAVAELIREADTLAALRHPNIGEGFGWSVCLFVCMYVCVYPNIGEA